MVLEDTSERRILNISSTKKAYYTDVRLGLYIVRGDSMVLLGEVNDTNSSDDSMTEVSLEKFEKLQQQNSADDPLTWEFDIDLVV